MIIINDKSKKVDVNFPKTYQKFQEKCELHLFDNSGNSYEFQVNDVSILNRYYSFQDMDFKDVPDGEYTYIVKGYKYDYGVIRIGDVTPTIKENKDNGNKIIQYGE